TVQTASGAAPGIVTLTGTNAGLRFSDFQTFNGATVNIGSTSSGNSAVLAVGQSDGSTVGSSQLILGSGVTLNSSGGNKFAVLTGKTNTDTIINNGTIQAAATGGFFTIAGPMTNNGGIAVTNGDIVGFGVSPSTPNANTVASGQITLNNAKVGPGAGSL